MESNNISSSSSVNEMDSSGQDSIDRQQANNEFRLNATLLRKRAETALEVGRIEEAQSLMADALQIKTQMFGDLSPECVDDYILYGRIILKEVKSSTELFNDAKTDEKLKEKEEEIETEEKVEKEEKIETEEKEEKEEKTETEEKEEKEQIEEKEEEEEEEEEEDNSTKLERAWEVLEVARVIAEKHFPSTPRLADIYLSVGDVSLEFERYKEAIDDYTKALETRTKIGEKDNREIAEIYYLIGLAWSNLPDSLDECVKNFKEALRILELVKENSKATDLDDIIQEIKNKLEGFKEEEVELKKTIKTLFEQSLTTEVKEMISTLPAEKQEEAIKNAIEKAGAKISSSTQNVPVHDFGVVGSVKRKRTDDNPQKTEDTEEKTKKSKTE